MGNTDQKILIVTSQALPEKNMPATGGGIRAYALGEALKSKGHAVYYSIPHICCDPTDNENLRYKELAHGIKNLDTIINRVQPDSVLFCNWGLAVEALECDLPTIIDMNGSLILENYYRNRGKIFEDSLAKIEAIAKADYLLAGSTHQKDYLTAWSLMAGRQPEDIAIGVVPFSLSPEVPGQADWEGDDFILAGYDWPWLEGNEYLGILCNELEAEQRGMLHIYSSIPPFVDVFQEEKSFTPTPISGSPIPKEATRLIHHQPVSFSELTNRLSNATVAIDLWKRNPERELAVSSRAVAYLWAGLPVITSHYGEFASLIRKYNAGWVIEENNHEQLRAVIGEILAAPKEDLRKYHRNAATAFAENFAWDKTIEPLDQFCRSPGKTRPESTLTSRYLFYQQLAERLQNHVEDRDLHLAERDNRILEMTCRLEELKKRINELAAAANTTEMRINALADELAAAANTTEMLTAESELVWRIQRKPKGFAVLQNPSGLIRNLRRLVVGVPLLLYLTALTLAGHCLHVCSSRLGRR